MIASFRNNIDSLVQKEYGNNKLIKNISNSQLFFNYELLHEMNINIDSFQQKLSNYIMMQDNIHRVYTREQVVNGAYTKE